MPTSMWPSQMVVRPRSGTPNRRCIDTSISSSDRPTITSGITSGALIMPEKRVRPRKRGWRSSVSAASVPSTTEPVALAAAICSDRNSAWRMSSSPTSFSYQRSEKPAQTLGTGESVKL